MQKNRRNRLIAAGVAAGALTAGAVMVVANLHRWLVLSDPPPQSLDVLLKFSGDTGRDSYLLQLAKRYPDAKLVVSGPSRKKFTKSMQEQDIDTSRLCFIDTCKSTWDEIEFFGRCLPGINSGRSCTVGLISSPYHMRRISLMVARGLPRSGFRYYYLPVPAETEDWLSASRTHGLPISYVREKSFIEVMKMVHFFVTPRKGWHS